MCRHYCQSCLPSEPDHDRMMYRRVDFQLGHEGKSDCALCGAARQSPETSGWAVNVGCADAGSPTDLILEKHACEACAFCIPLKHHAQKAHRRAGFGRQPLCPGILGVNDVGLPTSAQPTGLSNYLGKRCSANDASPACRKRGRRRLLWS